jgi:hypothetical protein
MYHPSEVTSGLRSSSPVNYGWYLEQCSGAKPLVCCTRVSRRPPAQTHTTVYVPSLSVNASLVSYLKGSLRKTLKSSPYEHDGSHESCCAVFS